MDMTPKNPLDENQKRGARLAQSALLAEVKGNSKEVERILQSIVDETNRDVVTGFLFFAWGWLGGYLRDTVKEKGPDAITDLILTFLDPDRDFG